ncbi:extracellular solute-binding protein [Fibrobacter sp. UWB10]|uniref:extracellular solute-binding protein n=1 Tax=Fibrobacter sp. UWB10 TaxID=1896201 RepID=UPI0024035AA1|nr:extracellular solute-binding protein [Fibrobacter sp. UWB10]SMP56800.1 microcin C transport system substrate-binding protein [Fibrobacter sp. UWB10]
MKNKKMKFYSAAFMSAALMVSALSLSACNESGSKGTKSAGKNAELNCPESPFDSTATGEFDPIASKDARPCGAITLWGSAMPKSFNMWEDYNSFSAELMGMMFEPLVSLHSTEDREVGILADSWSVSEDGKTFTFHVDPRAKWSDGKSVTAEDVQFYYDVIMDEKNLTPIFKVGLSRFDRPEVVDSLTVKMTAKESHWGNFWEAAGMLAFPKHVWAGKDFNQIRYEFPVVSGPYKIKTFREDRYVELARRADWWGFKKNWNRGKYNFEKIRYRFMNDQTKALEAFKKQDINAYAIYTSSIWMKQTDFDAIQKGWAVKQRIFNKEPIGFQGMAINLRKPQFQDVRVRRALNMLLNREAMNEKYMYNQYFLLNSYYPDLWEGNQNPTATLYKFNPDSARALFAEAGYKVNAQGVLEKDGKPFAINFITSQEDLRHLTLFQEDLKKVGVVATIEQMSQSTLRKRLDDADFDLYWVNWGAGRLRDPEASWISTTALQKGTNNLAGVQDKVVDSLINLQKTEFDLAKRNEILKALDNRLAEIVPYVLMWQCDHHRILYWNRYGTPEKVFDRFNREDAIPVYWWLDPTKSAALDKAMKAGESLPIPEYDVK